MIIRILEHLLSKIVNTWTCTRQSTYLPPPVELGIVPKRGVRAKQPRIAAAVLADDALRLGLAHGPGILERVARAEELFPAVRVPRLEL